MNNIRNILKLNRITNNLTILNTRIMYEKIKDFILKQIQHRKEKTSRLLVQQANSLYDLTEIDGIKYLNIDGTLIPVEHLVDPSKTLSYVRDRWVMNHFNSAS